MSRLIRRSSKVAVAIAAASLVLAPAMGAQASPGVSLTDEQRSAALWYANDWFQFDKLADANATGAGVTIAVIDGAINPDVPELAGANLTVKGSACVNMTTGKPADVVSTDPGLAEHGTNVVSMIIGNGIAADGGPGTRGIAPNAEVWFYGIGEVSDEAANNCLPQDPSVQPVGIDLSDDVILLDGDSERAQVAAAPAVERSLGSTAVAARAAIRDGADIISLSVASGDSSDFDQVLAEAHLAGVLVVAATPNPDIDILVEFGGPWRANGAVPVGAVDANGEVLISPSTGDVGGGSSMLAFTAPGVNVLGVGSSSAWEPTVVAGTSIATPLIAGSIAAVMSAHADMSANQAVNALIRTTGDGRIHEPVWFDEEFGFGYANPLGAITVPLSELTDENPMFVSSLDDERCTEPNGSPGSLLSSGTWVCSWSAGPFPPAIAEYRAVLAGEKSATDGYSSPATSVYDRSANDAPNREPHTAPLRILTYVGASVAVVGALVAGVVVFLRRKSAGARS